MGTESPQFRLSVWQPAQRRRLLEYAAKDGEDIESALIFNSDRLQEEIYQWRPGQEDVWGCFRNPETSNRLRELFIERFAPRLPPEKRSMNHFKAAIKELEQELANEETSTWADTIQSVRTGSGDPVNLRGNCALSLWNHLEWIQRTFGHLPGASVTIR